MWLNVLYDEVKGEVINKTKEGKVEHNAVDKG